MADKILDYQIGAHKIAEIPADRFVIETEYQRMLNEAKVDAISRQYNPHLDELLTVNRRKNGEFALIDGQHRLASGRRLGHDKFVCRVVEVSPEEEARLFIDLNRNRIFLTPVAMFKAELAAKVPIAIEITKVLAERDFHIGKKEGRGRIECVVALKRIYSRGGWVGLARALDALCLAWPDDEPGRFQANVLLGVDEYLHRRKGDVDLNALGFKLSKVTARRLLAQASEAWHSSRREGKASMVDCVASEIERLHRRKVVAA